MHWRIVLLFMLLGAAGTLLGSGSASARAATIENVATLSYELGGAAQQVNSNRVVITSIAAPSPSTLIFRRDALAGNGEQTSASDGLCRTSSGVFEPIPLPKEPSGDAPSLDPVTLADTSVIRAGELLYITIRDANRNADPAVRETIDVLITTDNGDEETLRLAETDSDSGEFTAPIATKIDPPAAQRADCELSVASGSDVHARYVDADYPDDISTGDLLVDPLGRVFDSASGALIDGARVTLIDSATGQPAQVFGDDGVSAYPSTVTTGAEVTDASGRVYPATSGAFRFPLLQPGTYQLRVEPPPGWTVPSTVPPDAIAALTDPSGLPFIIAPGSYLQPFVVTGPEPYRLDVPADAIAGSLLLTKAASVDHAEIGDFVQYRLSLANSSVGTVAGAVVNDTLPPGLRYARGSLRVNGQAAGEPTISADGRALAIPLPPLASGASVELSYVAAIGPGTRSGDAVNRAIALIGSDAASNEARARVRIVAPLFTDAITLIGRITEGGCSIDSADRRGVPGVRVLLDDGQFAITDRDGLYHFEGVRPGTHVVQLDRDSMAGAFEPQHCIRNSRSGGRAFSRFVEAQGGSLQRVDFMVKRISATIASPPKAEHAVASDSDAAGADRDWLALADGRDQWLFPAEGYNPRSPVTRVAIAHAASAQVVLSVNGIDADALTHDGTSTDATRGAAVSRWRGIALRDGENRLVARIRTQDGRETILERRVWFINVAERASLLRDQSLLVADGRSRPQIRIRITDAAGRPVRSGTTGRYTINAPYRPAQQVDAEAARQLAGLDQFDTTWRVDSDDGVATIELAPTVQTGTVELGIELGNGRVRTVEDLRAWLKPGENQWVVVGFAAGTAGFNTLSRNSEALGDTSQDQSFTDGQLSFFARGRVRGDWLLTLAYDSDKPADPERQRLLGTIDPQRYYTVYGDGSEQGYGAASIRKLYLRIERDQFYALFGDYETGFTQSELSRYSRTVNGFKTEYRSERLAVSAFASDTAQRYARDELQGSGLSGPYRLSRRDVLLNSDKVTIETRDRLRPEIIVRSDSLARHIDYDIDYDAATVRFRSPVPSRDEDLNPVWIVVDYETEGAAGKDLNAGGRIEATLAAGRAVIAATALRDANDGQVTTLFGTDARVALGERTELRGEIAHSDSDGTALAWLGEVEHRGERLNLLAYAREQQAGFGVGQQSRSLSGTRKFGVDARYELNEAFDINASLWTEEQTEGPGQRTAGELRADYARGDTTLRGGLRFADDRVQSGASLRSTLLTLGASQYLLQRKLRIDADTEIALGSAESTDFPSRYALGASYALTSDFRLIGRYELRDGEAVDSSTLQFGIDVAPWGGARIASTLNQQAIGENGSRTYAAFGLQQSLLVGERWAFDVAFDSNYTFNGRLREDDLVDPDVPSDNGGYLGSDGLTEDFWALSLGATYRSELWSWTSRAEYRDGNQGDRWNLQSYALRSLGDGKTLSVGATASRAKQFDGAVARDIQIDGAIALRPLGERWALLDKVSFRLEDARAGTSATLPLTRFTEVGDGRSRRLVNNLALNLVGRPWSPDDGGGLAEQRAQASLYWGTKYVFDRYDGQDFDGFTQVIGADLRRDIAPWLDVGASAAVRHNWDMGAVDYMAGVSIGVSPINNGWFSIGYNIAGYDDHDFDADHYTRDGPYVTLRFKFDELTAQNVLKGLRP